MTHTKGPWKRGGNYGTLKTEVVTEDGAQAIATVWARRFKHREPGQVRSGKTEPWLEGEANLNLILAAPDLLEALEEVEWVYDGEIRFCPWCGNNQVYGHDSKCLRQTATAKAKG